MRTVFGFLTRLLYAVRFCIYGSSPNELLRNELEKKISGQKDASWPGNIMYLSDSGQKILRRADKSTLLRKTLTWCLSE